MSRHGQSICLPPQDVQSASGGAPARSFSNIAHAPSQPSAAGDAPARSNLKTTQAPCQLLASESKAAALPGRASNSTQPAAAASSSQMPESGGLICSTKRLQSTAAGDPKEQVVTPDRAEEPATSLDASSWDDVPQQITVSSAALLCDLATCHYCFMVLLLRGWP